MFRMRRPLKKKKKHFIEDIKVRHLQSDKEYGLESLSGAIDRIQKTFPRYGSFLMEFVQNADDAKSKSLGIEISSDDIIIFNNGFTFSEENVKSICKVGCSSKTVTEDYIGYLGVGFKAVFLISEYVEIYSGGFRFKFDKNSWDDPYHIPWQIIPIWIDSPQIDIPRNYTTEFKLHLKEINILEKLKEEVTQEHLNTRILLFLRHISEIEINDNTNDYKRRITRSISAKKSKFEIHQIREFENESLKNQEQWLLFRSTCKVPEDVHNDYVTIEWERGEVEKREVLVAFKLDREKNLVKEEKGTAHIGVFSFLPLKELPSGLHFLIQADFLTTPGRAELIRECMWNTWLANEILNLIITKCIPTFIQHKKWKLNYTELLYSKEGSHELFEDYIKSPMREYLEDNDVLITEDGSTANPEEGVFLDQEIRELLKKRDLDVLYPGKKVIHPESSIPWEIQNRLADKPSFSARGGLSSMMVKLLELKSERKEVRFFLKFYSKNLVQKFKDSSQGTLNSLRSLYIFLTEDFDLTNAHSIYIKPKDLKIPKEVRKSFQIVHSAISTNHQINKFFKLIGIDELTKEHIQSELKTRKIPQIRQNWTSCSNKKKIEYIIFCKDLWEENLVSIHDLDFLTLKSKTKKWLNPGELVFSKEYKPDHILEILIKEKNLLDIPLEFLSSEFIKSKTDDEIIEWRKFFNELGVDENVDRKKSHIVQRIGILTALKYEERKDRKIARELGESEKLGYDIKSKERYIEVKGSNRSNPEFTLKTNEFKTLQKNPEKYFVYVIKDALQNPSLSVLHGEELLLITDIAVTYSYNRWYGVKYEEFQP